MADAEHTALTRVHTCLCNEALYEWWKNKIFTEVKVGGRYFSIMALCAYGLKYGSLQVFLVMIHLSDCIGYGLIF